MLRWNSAIDVDMYGAQIRPARANAGSDSTDRCAQAERQHGDAERDDDADGGGAQWPAA